MNKKLFWCTLIALFICIFCGIKIKTENISYAESAELIDNESIIVEENVKTDLHYYLDLVAIGAGAVITALSFYIPIYIKIKKAKNNIENITNTAINESNKHEKIINDFKNYEKKLIDKEKELKEYENKISELCISMKNTEKMCKVAFSNIKELVQNGVARKIVNIGGDNEEKNENNLSQN